MARPPTPDVRITEALQPAAAVVNVGFAHPAPPAPSSLHGVAQALESLSSDLMSWGRKEEQRRKEEDDIRGEAEYYRQVGDGLAEGIRTDQIPANNSPEFIRGYKRAMGSSAGFNLATTIENEYASSDIKTNPDQNAFNSWFRRQIKDKVSTDDPSVLRGLNPHLRQIQNNLFNRWQADVAKDTTYKALSSYGALAASTIDAYSREGLVNKAGTDIETLGVTLDQIRDKGYALGLKREAIDQAMVDAINAKALEHRDPKLLKLLDRDSTAGPKLSDTPYGRDKKAETVKTLTSLWKQQTTEERLQQEREDKQATASAKSKIADLLLKDPNADIPDELIQTVISRGKDGDFKINLLQWRENVRKGTIAEDPKAVSQVMEEILKGGGQEAFWSAFNSGVIKSPETMKQAYSFMDVYAKANAVEGKILDTPTAKSYVANIETLGQDPKFSEQSVMGIRAMTEGGRAALNQYRYGLLRWQTENPNASPIEQAKFASELGEVMLKSLDPATGEYKPPTPQAIQPAPAPQPSAPPASPPSPAPAPAAAPSQWQQRIMESTAAPPRVEELGLSPEEMTILNTEAQRRNVQPQVIIDHMWSKRPGAQQSPSNLPTSTQPQSPRPEGPRSSLDLPGGLGQIQLVGVSPENLEMVRNAVASLNLLGPRIQQASLNPTDALGGLSEVLSSKRIAQINASPVGRVIERVAQRLGFDPDKAKVIASIESSGNPESGRGRPYKGLYQLNADEWRRYGNGTDIHNAEANAEAGIKSMMDKAARFQREFGREPSAVELYLMHQQGEAGLRAHERNMDQPAWQSMLSTGEGQRKGETWAKRAIWGNVPTDLRPMFGNVNNITSRQFIAVWTAKLMGISYEAALAQVGGSKTRSA